MNHQEYWILRDFIKLGGHKGAHMPAVLRMPFNIPREGISVPDGVLEFPLTSLRESQNSAKLRKFFDREKFITVGDLPIILKPLDVSQLTQYQAVGIRSLKPLENDLNLLLDLGPDKYHNRFVRFDEQNCPRILASEWVQAFLREFSDQERMLLKGRFSTPRKTLEDFGLEMGLTRERIRQMAKKALRKFKNMYAAEWKSVDGRLLRDLKVRGVMKLEEVTAEFSPLAAETESWLQVFLRMVVAGSKDFGYIFDETLIINAKESSAYHKIVERIDQRIDSLEGPLRLSDFSDLAVPDYFLRTYLTHEFDAKISELGDIDLGTDTKAKRILRCVHHLGSASLKNISNLYQQLYGPISVRNLIQSIRQIPEVLETSRNLFALSSEFGVGKAQRICDRLHKFLTENQNRFPHGIKLTDLRIAMSEDLHDLDDRLISSIVGQDDRFERGKRFLFHLAGQYRSLTDLAESLCAARKEPVTMRELKAYFKESNRGTAQSIAYAVTRSRSLVRIDGHRIMHLWQIFGQGQKLIDFKLAYTIADHVTQTAKQRLTNRLLLIPFIRSTMDSVPNASFSYVIQSLLEKPAFAFDLPAEYGDALSKYLRPDPTDMAGLSTDAIATEKLMTALKSVDYRTYISSLVDGDID